MSRAPAVFVPMPLQIVIDDVGWWSAEDGHERGEPFRTGIARNHAPADYEAIASLGRRLGMRPQAAMALCEWDRDDLLRETPTSTWMGASWTNRRWVGPWLDEAADILRRNDEHVEVALHGLGHEYWQDGAMSRAEWHDLDGNMRPEVEVRRHLEACARILERNGLGPMPPSFVPCAFLHRFGTDGGGFAAIAREYGIRYISTPFKRMIADAPPQEADFGVDCGVMTVDRGACPILWHTLDACPFEGLSGPILGLHWPNVLHEDPVRSGETVARWAEFLEQWAMRPDRMLARDTRECWTQLAHRSCLGMEQNENGLALDFGRLDRLAPEGIGDSFYINIAADFPLHFEAKGASVEAACPSAAGQYALRMRREPKAGKAFLGWRPADSTRC